MVLVCEKLVPMEHKVLLHRHYFSVNRKIDNLELKEDTRNRMLCWPIKKKVNEAGREIKISE